MKETCCVTTVIIFLLIFTTPSYHLWVSISQIMQISVLIVKKSANLGNRKQKPTSTVKLMAEPSTEDPHVDKSSSRLL